MNSKAHETILINVLTRTSNRPKGFKKCYTSVKQQTYKHIRHIVTYDNDDDWSYLKNLDIDTVNVTPLKQNLVSHKYDDEGNLYAPYNLYSNALLNEVKDGWILFLDDDDNFYHNKVVEILVSKLSMTDPDTLFIWQMRYPDGRLLPSDAHLNQKTILKNTIGSPCYLFHCNYKDKARWDAYKASDFRFFEQLKNQIPKLVFINQIFVQINNYGDYGNLNDIDSSGKSTIHLPLSFYRNGLTYLIPKYHTRFKGALIFHPNTYQTLFNKLKNKVSKIFRS